MKHLIYIAFLFLSVNIFSQSKYLTKTGTVGFEASVPSFEEVKASNNSVTAIINTDNGEFAALVLVKGFRFKNALMEEHFNENYAESDTYPKAAFKGKIEDFQLASLSNTNMSFKISGELSFHGKTKQFHNLDVEISKENDVINLMGSFKTLASYFDIKIPKIVKNKIAEDIQVFYDFKLKKK
ncbi:YceI family protein [Seonamhaeicola sediminis]|uniref:YceI family protein n=1 Tax=Seonamhaeicola sediminis TaxID=2528206 RepID=A0A562YCN9_9FLAO|nr:YceI family protein [Seonamhaeicola sediminis]TWO31878.1 YceI family protein [Seonamhaeicola sediminis]